MLKLIGRADASGLARPVANDAWRVCLPEEGDSDHAGTGNEGPAKSLACLVRAGPPGYVCTSRQRLRRKRSRYLGHPARCSSSGASWRTSTRATSSTCPPMPAGSPCCGRTPPDITPCCSGARTARDGLPSLLSMPCGTLTITPTSGPRAGRAVRRNFSPGQRPALGSPRPAARLVGFAVPATQRVRIDHFRRYFSARIPG